VLAKTEEIFAEPLAPASEELRLGSFERTERSIAPILCEVTGSGLKRPSEALEALKMLKPIPATPKDFEKTSLNRYVSIRELTKNKGS